jgi:hypothetical protein
MSTQATGQGLTVAVTNDNTMSFDLLLRQADVLSQVESFLVHIRIDQQT